MMRISDICFEQLRGLEQRREWEARRFFDPDELEPMKRRDWSDFHQVKSQKHRNNL